MAEPTGMQARSAVIPSVDPSDPPVRPGLVFISHENGDHGLAVEIRSYLEAGGFRGWMAPDDIAGSAPWPEQIGEAIDACDVMLVVVSSNANQSSHVAREVDLAIERGKPLLPVRVEDIAPTGALDYLLRLSQWLDLFPGSIADHSGALRRMVTALLEERGIPIPEPGLQPEAEPVPHRISIGRSGLIMAAVAIVVVGAGWFGIRAVSNGSTPDLSEAQPTTASTLAATSTLATTTASTVEPSTPSGVAGLALGEDAAISVDSHGTIANAHSDNPTISADGRFVAFDSIATNLVEGDTNGFRDIFIHDTETGETVRIVGPDGTEGNGHSYDPQISGDGQVVVFVSEADNLLAPSNDMVDANEASDVYRYKEDGDISLISLTPDGNQHLDNSIDPSISDDAGIIAYATYPGTTTPRPGRTGQGWYRAWVHDPTMGTTTLLAEDDTSNPDGWHIRPPLVSRNGSLVALAIGSKGAVVYQCTDTCRELALEGTGLSGEWASQEVYPGPDGERLFLDRRTDVEAEDGVGWRVDLFEFDLASGTIDLVRRGEGGETPRVTSVSMDSRFLAVFNIEGRGYEGSILDTSNGVLHRISGIGVDWIEVSANGHWAVWASERGPDQVWMMRLQD